MAGKEIALMAHLMRRAGFGAPYPELEARAAKGYEATVEELLDPDAHSIPEFDELEMARFYPGHDFPTSSYLAAANFMYHLVTTPRLLEEKIALFWHMVFATGATKVANPGQMVHQIAMFRRHGLDNYRDLLMRLAEDPAMIFWLDNQENHKGAPNENWSRELLELFSMGQGNYTEQDVYEAARAFTGWTIKPKVPGFYLWDFEFRAEDHDSSEKLFLGRQGRFNGEDVIDIIVQQPATNRFIARHLYNFFVADDVQVPSWNDVPPRDPQAVQAIAETFVGSSYDIRSTLRFLFNSEFFKDESAWFAKIKSPAEVVAGNSRLIGDFRELEQGVMLLHQETVYQGQTLLDPPSVEGWHTGHEWIDGGSLVRRINFCANRLSDTSMPGVRYIIDGLASKGSLSPEDLVDGCLELLGAIRLDEETRQTLIEHARDWTDIKRDPTEQEARVFSERVTEILRLVAAAKEYQFC